jgi:RND family efflux transporter MFP subunit
MVFAFKFRPGFIVAALLAGLRWAAAEVPAANAAPSPSAPSAPSTASATVPRGSFRSVLQAVNDVRLSSRAAGVVETIHVAEGSHVKKDQPIISLDADQEKAEVAQAEAALRGAQAEVERAEAEFKRMDQLHTENISAEKFYVDAKAAAALARSRADQAAATLQLAKVRLANRTITAPFDGIFLKTNKQVGEAVDRYETVAEVVDVTSLEMMVFCDARYFSQFRAGQRMEIRVFKSPEEQPIISGVIIHKDPIIDAGGTFRIKIKIEPSADAVPGLVAYVKAPPS